MCSPPMQERQHRRDLFRLGATRRTQRARARFDDGYARIGCVSAARAAASSSPARQASTAASMADKTMPIEEMTTARGDAEAASSGRTPSSSATRWSAEIGGDVGVQVEGDHAVAVFEQIFRRGPANARSRSGDEIRAHWMIDVHHGRRCSARSVSSLRPRGAVAFTVTLTNVQLFDQMTNRADADLRANKVVRCGIDVERCLAEQRLHSLYGRERRRQLSARMLVSPSPTSDMHVVQALYTAGPTHTHTDGAVPKPGRERYAPGRPMMSERSTVVSKNIVAVCVDANAGDSHCLSASTISPSFTATSTSNPSPSAADDRAVTRARSTIPIPVHHRGRGRARSRRRSLLRRNGLRRDARVPDRRSRSGTTPQTAQQSVHDLAMAVTDQRRRGTDRCSSDERRDRVAEPTDRSANQTCTGRHGHVQCPKTSVTLVREEQPVRADDRVGIGCRNPDRVGGREAGGLRR